MNKNYKLLIGIGALAALYFVFKKKGTTAKSTSTDKAESSTIKSAKVEGGTMSIDEKELLDNVKRKSEIKAGDSPKVIAIKKFAVDVFSNQPKSPEEFLARASKAGLSQADLQSPEAQKIMNPFASFEDGKTRIKPSSVSGLSVSKRPRNYGTAQRPTRALMGKKRTSDGMDFDGNDDVQSSIM